MNKPVVVSVHRLRTSVTVSMCGITDTMRPSEIVEAACKAARETGASIFGFTFTRDPDVRCHATVILYTD